MRALFLLLLLSGPLVRGNESGAFVAEPNPVARVAEALAGSGIERLTPRISEQAGRLHSYHVESIRYLGWIRRGDEKVVLATAKFIRSSAEGVAHPPARGHGFLLCLTEGFELVSHSRLDLCDDVRLAGTDLVREGQRIADFSSSSEATRQNGFLVDGGDSLPYPFSDNQHE